METPFRASLLVAPFTAVAVALGALLLLPGFSALGGPPEPGAKPPPACESAPGADPKLCTEVVELEVRDVVPLREAQTHAVVLSTKDGATVLPIFVDEASAVAIAFRLAHRESPHPLSQDLLDSVVRELGGKVAEVRIDDLRDNVYFGRVIIVQGAKRLALDARPSDSIAMALGGEARILCTRKVLGEAGISREELDGLRGGRGGPGVGGSGPAPRSSPKLPPDDGKEIQL